MTSADTELVPFALRADNAVAYLESRGFNLPNANARALAGGVSGTVIGITGPRPLVVKQALPRLLVEAEWEATTDRALTEARAIELLHTITPNNVPELLDSDEQNSTLTMSRAPDSWSTWKDVLLVGASPADFDRAERIGAILGRWHSATWHNRDTAQMFADDLAFEQLRVAPFHREVLRQHPELAAPMTAVIGEVIAIRQCLVHGDFSPKNILIGEPDTWVLDFEVARYGAAIFDVAFLLSHLLLKAVHLPRAASTVHGVGRAFLDAYCASNAGKPDLTNLGWQIAALLLARVSGKSPAGYLTAHERVSVKTIAMDLLHQDHPTPEQAWVTTFTELRKRPR